MNEENSHPQAPASGNIWRCLVTGNPVGTDTRLIGQPPCQCQVCRLCALSPSQPAPVAREPIQVDIALAIEQLAQSPELSAKLGELVAPEYAKALTEAEAEIARLTSLLASQTKPGPKLIRAGLNPTLLAY